MGCTKRKLPEWSKEVKKAMIDQDLTVTELAVKVDLSRTYVTQVINNRLYAPEVASKISEALHVKEPYIS